MSYDKHFTEKTKWRKKVDFSVNIDIDNSQDWNLDENELDKIIIEAKPVNTRRNTGSPLNMV